MVLSKTDEKILASIQDGLPLVARPYAAIARRSGLTEVDVRERIAVLQSSGIIKRLGIVVRHQELGYRANAMVVWNVPDDRVSDLGERIGTLDCVTLCYRRKRSLPDWPYNLFCMIHGRSRESVLERIDEIITVLDITQIPHEVLFSGRRFKQRGARYLPADEPQIERWYQHG
jgi:DNA-binding Lrp family transcriptional regulator